ncbi:MAG TPA: aldehyde dehydrogenase family protein [Pyrinomonadaceae bacterium]|nr:aldehyde dehydrogenase family protein [Pyrinomonadaceae bacterium]
MLKIPILRHGEPYTSLDVVHIAHHRTAEPFVEVSQANAGLIRRDLRDQAETRRALSRISTRQLIEICRQAAEIFLGGTLSIGGDAQTPDDYVYQVSATTGLPHVMARKNMLKIHSMMFQMESVLRGLTRSLEWDVLDRGFGEVDGHTVSFFRCTDALGVVLPNNSPGVHSLWIPAFALKIPLVLKPGSAEPWTPFRIIQALISAGAPASVFSFYPTDHAGGSEILRICGRGMVFGDTATVGAWENDTRVQIHGPGYSKVIIGEDCVDEWEQYLDVITASIVENGGRSCVNASAVWTPRYSEAISEALAERLARIKPKPAEDENAQIAPFTDGSIADRISGIIDQGLVEAGASDITARYRSGERVVQWNGCTYLLPTIIRCETLEHPLANKEFLFPFASILEVEANTIVESLSPSLVVTAITRDSDFIQRLVASPNVDRLNIGPVPTNQVSWDQPHEGNLFEHLYSRRAFQRAASF